MHRTLQSLAAALAVISLMVEVASAAIHPAPVGGQAVAYLLPPVGPVAQATTPTGTPQAEGAEALPPIRAAVTSSPALTATQLPPEEQGVAPLATPAPVEADLDAAYSGALAGTIVANRSDSNARFFLEGATFDLAAGRSVGLPLPRAAAVLNLFNCDAGAAESQPGCYWDPYLLASDGFYEILDGDEAGRVTALILLEAGTPPSNQLWVHNRTGKRENIVHNDQTYELPPATVAEFPVSDSVPGILYLRSCIHVGQESRCEWTPQSAEAGIYYALVEMTTNGAQPNSWISSVTLQPVLAKAGEAPEAPPQMLCRLEVPTINIRSGPGLEYEITAKVRETENGPGTVLVVGRDASGEWLAVDDRVARGGWVTASAQYIRCDGDIANLPERDVSDGRLVEGPTPTPEPAPTAAVAAAPTATPVAAEPTAAVPTEVQEIQTPAATDTPEIAAPEPEVTATPEVQATPEALAETATPEPEPAAPAVPPGLAMLVITNGFHQDIRFTLDQSYRVVEGPSEYDLKPGESSSILVFPGQLSFTASSAWNGLSGNSVYDIAGDETANLWLQFIPAADGSGQWQLIY